MTPLITNAMANSNGPIGGRDKNEDANFTIMYGTSGASIPKSCKGTCNETY